jgi:hypothetical protein
LRGAVYEIKNTGEPSPTKGIPYRLDYRFEYCGRLRAFLSPTFFRSTSRESRVTNPAFRKGARNVSSYLIRARVIP